jgi:drug/metabolite transporter (DMT)-like permease
MSEMKLLAGVLIVVGLMFIGMRDKVIDGQTENTVLRNMYEYNLISGLSLMLLGVVIITYSNEDNNVNDYMFDTTSMSTEPTVPSAPMMLE